MGDSSLLKQLALYGGYPAIPEGPPDWPASDSEVRDALMAAWASGDWGRYHGKHHEQLCEQLAQLHSAQPHSAQPHSTQVDSELCFWLCSSGTFAVELALRSLALPEQSEVILAGYDFAGNFRAIEAAGLRPVLAEIDATGWRLTPDTLEAVKSHDTRAVIVSHLHGALADMPAIREFADRNGWKIVEDACQSTAAKISGRFAGTWGDVGVLSFGGSKLLSAGRGGAIFTRQADIFQRAKIFCERGNNAYPLSELQAAVLVPQVRRILERNERRRAGVEQLLSRIAGCPGLHAPKGAPPGSAAAFYKLGWHFVASECGGHSRQTFIDAIQAEGVAIDEGFRGFTLRSSRRCRSASALYNARHSSSSTLILHHPVLLADDRTIERVAEAINKVVNVMRQVPV